MRRCKACGQPITDKPRAIYCNDRCRAAYGAGKRAPAEVAQLPGAAGEPVEQPDELLTLDDLARELRRTLLSPSTPPNAKAGLSREYRAVLEEIDRTKPRPKDGVDELLERRLERA